MLIKLASTQIIYYLESEIMFGNRRVYAADVRSKLLLGYNA